MKWKPGIYPIYKPKGPTSHDMINRLRKMTGIKRIGHAGTLDPLASGVLVIAIGRDYTKQISKYTKLDKEYVATIHLGLRSETDDAQGVRKEEHQAKDPKCDQAKLEQIMKKFVGEIEQIPPKYSALKIKGKPAHRRMRAGEEVHMKPRKVSIYKIDLMNYAWPMLTIRVHCGSGVYIRSLARDIGEELGVGGYLAELERTRVGKFEVGTSIDLDKKGLFERLASLFFH